MANKKESDYSSYFKYSSINKGVKLWQKFGKI